MREAVISVDEVPALRVRKQREGTFEVTPASNTPEVTPSSLVQLVKAIGEYLKPRGYTITIEINPDRDFETGK